jgi:2-hydroxychromene-2-carboxylate isomerase
MLPPPSHPFNTHLALRAASLPLQESERAAAVEALFRAVWAGGPGVETEESVSRVLTGAGLDGGRLVAQARTQEAKDRLRQQTDAAIAAGVFGVPTMIVDHEMFWGHDDLDFMDRYLAGADPLPRAVIPAWERLRPTAWRKEAPKPR